MFDVTLFDLKFVIIGLAISEYISFQMHHVLISLKNEQKTLRVKTQLDYKQQNECVGRNVFVRTKLH